MIRAEELFDLSHTLAAPLLRQYAHPWECLPFLKEFILSLGPTLPKEIFEERERHIWIAKDARISPSAFIAAPCIIGRETEIRHGAFIRGSALIGEKAVIGNSTEIKNAILFDGVQAPHFNYIGDSILGYKAHLGAGAVTSNVKNDKSLVSIHIEGKCIPTNLKKLGALMGDASEAGCGAVLNPGSVIGKRALLYPLSNIRGYVPADHIVKGDRGIFPRESRP